MRVLIVDDSRAMRMIVRRALRQAGYPDLEIEEAGCGDAALDAILESPPDLVLSDWNMPEMSGPELLSLIRLHGVQVRFGFVTSDGSPGRRAEASEAGALFLVAKPFSADELRDALDTAFSEQAAS